MELIHYNTILEAINYNEFFIFKVPILKMHKHKEKHKGNE